MHEVYQDHVLIERGGRIEQLLLPHQHGTGVVPAPVAAGDNPLDRARRMITENPGVIADVMRPQPVTLGGKLQGYRLFPGRNARAFARLGLRSGDMVVGINGTPLDDANRAQEVFDTLGSASEAHITIRRNGRQQDLTLNMSQLSDAEQLVGTEAGSGDAASPNPATPAAQGANPAAAPGPVPPPVPPPTAPATGADTPNNPND